MCFLKPNDFLEHPWDSVLQNSESEVVARNIMVILNRTGWGFREMTWGEYKKERLQDGNFSEREKPYFEKVMPYCMSAEKAQTFSPAWNKDGFWRRLDKGFSKFMQTISGLDDV